MPLDVEAGCGVGPCASSWRRNPGFAAIDEHPITGDFGQRYYPAVFGERRVDVSFAVKEDAHPVVVVPCTIGEGRLDYYGFPIRLFVRSDLVAESGQRAIAAAFLRLDQLAIECKATEVAICDDSGSGTLSTIGKQCLNRGAAANVRLKACCALDTGEAAMRGAMRKSFRSLVNWGRRNLMIKCVDRGNPDRELFSRYREFHAIVAGRVTRFTESWDVMFDWIAAGRGELVLGFLGNDRLVTGTMIVDGATDAFYASGVYDRDKFEHPLAHWPLWLAMLHAADRKLRLFDLGDIPLAGTASEKEISIGYFKRGFATTISTSIEWSWSPRGETLTRSSNVPG
jgi:hypothetical protein